MKPVLYGITADQVSIILSMTPRVDRQKNNLHMQTRKKRKINICIVQIIINNFRTKACRQRYKTGYRP